MCFPFLLKWQDKRPNSQYSDIVHIHLLLSVRDEPRRAQYYRDLLSHIQLVSTLIATIADGPLNIPMLKNVAVLVKNIVECRQAVNANRDDCDQLVEKTSGYLGAISAALNKDHVQLDAEFQGHIISFTNQLSRIQQLLVNLGARSYWSRLLQNKSDRRKILDCQAQLDQAFSRLQLTSIVHTAVRLNTIAVDVEHVRMLVSSSTDDLRLQLTEVRQAMTTLSGMQESRSPSPLVYGPQRPEPYEYTQRHQRSPLSTLRIVPEVVRTSLYRRISTSPYTASPLNVQWTGAAITRARESGMLNLRNRREATAAQEASSRRFAVTKMSGREQQGVRKIRPPSSSQMPLPLPFPESISPEKYENSYAYPGQQVLKEPA